MCLKGEKLVVFVTGVCRRKCFYCPLSFGRKAIDSSYANERKVTGVSSILYEAERMNATGAGITGGDPIVNVPRTVKFVKSLKRRFGKGFHVHLYTSGDGASPAKLSKLYLAGVDEIRFHFNRKEILGALKLPWKVGAEIPAIPGKWKEAVGYLEFLWKNGAKFCNINELDWSEQNEGAFRKRGYSLRKRESSAVSGSEEMARKLVEYSRRNFPGLSVHYCASATKDGVQTRKRFIRTAKNVAKKFERVDRDGLLVKGAVLGVKELPEIPRIFQFYNKGKRRVEFSEKNARKIAKLGKYSGRVFIVREQPTASPVDFEVTPVS
jgi:pyruvate formate-lyase activating enzyme-like uncharacterized protein